MKARITDDSGALIRPVALVVVVESKNGGHRFDVLRDPDRFSREQLRRILQNILLFGDHPAAQL